MSVARNASSSSGGTREVSPTTSAGSRARASGESPSAAVRSPARSRPASRCTALGAPVTRGAPPLTRTTAAIRSPSRSGGARRPWTRRRVDGSSPSQAARCSSARGWTVTRTGARVAVVVPPGPVTRVTSASRTTEAGASAAPRTRGRVSRGSPVTVTSAVASAYSRASAGTGPLRTSAPCSPATAPAAAPHSSIATTAPAARRPRHATARSGDAACSSSASRLAPRPPIRPRAPGPRPDAAPRTPGPAPDAAPGDREEAPNAAPDGSGTTPGGPGAARGAPGRTPDVSGRTPSTAPGDPGAAPDPAPGELDAAQDGPDPTPDDPGAAPGTAPGDPDAAPDAPGRTPGAAPDSPGPAPDDPDAAPDPAPANPDAAPDAPDVAPEDRPAVNRGPFRPCPRGRGAMPPGCGAAGSSAAQASERGTGEGASGPRREWGSPGRRPPGVGVARRRALMSRTAATREAMVQARVTVWTGASRARAAAAQAARAGGTRRRSGGPSWRGCEAPRGDAAVAWTEARARVGFSAVTAGPADADRRTGAHRCRSPRGVHQWIGNLRAGCGSR